MARTSRKELKVKPDKVFRQFGCRSAVYDVEPGGQVEAMAVTTYGGILKSLAFMSGVAKHFEIKGFTVNRNVIPPAGRDWRTGPIWNVAGVVVPAGAAMLVLAKNITNRPQKFCIIFTVESETGPDWKPKRR